MLSQEDLYEVLNEVALPQETFDNDSLEIKQKKIFAKRQLPELEKPLGKGKELFLNSD